MATQYVIRAWIKRRGWCAWDGKKWSKTKAMVFPTMTAADKASWTVPITNADSVTVEPYKG